MYLFLWMENQELMGNDPFLALVAEEWFEDDDAKEKSSVVEEEDEDGEDEDDKDMELFYFTTALDTRLCSVKKESCCSTSQLVTTRISAFIYCFMK